MKSEHNNPPEQGEVETSNLNESRNIKEFVGQSRGDLHP